MYFWILTLLSYVLCLHSISSKSTTTQLPSICGWPGGKSKIPQIWHKEKIPNPQIDTCKCGRSKKSWVCDPNGLITNVEADRIDEKIENLRNTTGACHCSGKKCGQGSYLGPNYHGYQAGVALVNQMYPKNGKSKDPKKTADDITDYLREDKWRFGLCDDDFIIIVSDVDRVVYTATGDSISTIVTDKCVKEITANNKHYLSSKKYGDALAGMITEYNQALLKEHSCNKPLKPTSWTTILAVIGAFVACVAGFCGILYVYRKCKGEDSNSRSTSTKYEATNKSDDSSHRVRHDSVASQKSASSGGGGDTF